MRDEVDEKRNVGFDAADTEFLQTALHATGGIDEAQASRRHLDQQRIVERRDDRAGEGAAVEADAHAAGRAVVAELAVVGQEVARRVFRRHAALHGEAVRADVGLVAQANLRIAERPALRDLDLALDDVVAGDLFGDGMFDLDARIDLDEVELAGLGIDQELDGAGVVEPDGPADGEGSVENALPQLRVKGRSGGDLDDLLMPALHGAIALEEMDEVAVAVA